jgi:hypothetical protein
MNEKHKKKFITFNASAVQSDTDHPLSAVESVHEPFDL